MKTPLLGRRRVPRAGRYATSRYERGLRAWRRKTRLIRFMFCGPFILAGSALVVIDGHWLSGVGGAIVAMFAAFWVELTETPPRYVETWRDGAEGERKTEKALLPLERVGWTTVHDVQVEHGNLDHVVVGPGGVFLLETKNLQGVAQVQDGLVVLKRRLDPEAVERFERIRGGALAAAAEINQGLRRRTDQNPWVQAVVVFWSDFPQGFVNDGRCVYLHGSRLRSWLEEQPHRLSVDAVGALSEALIDFAGEQEQLGAAETA